MLSVGSAQMPNIDAKEVIIENHSIAIKLIDWKVRDLGWLIQTWQMILGCDAAGVVVEIGSDVHHLKQGDRVLGHAVSLVSQ